MLLSTCMVYDLSAKTVEKRYHITWSLTEMAPNPPVSESVLVAKTGATWPVFSFLPSWSICLPCLYCSHWPGNTDLWTHLLVFCHWAPRLAAWPEMPRGPLAHSVSVLPSQVPYQWTAGARRSLPAGRVRSWTWRGTCTWAGCRRTVPASSSPLSSGLPCSTTAMWAASVTCSLTGAARTSGSWRRCRTLRASSPPVHGWVLSSATATPARTTQCARMAGTASSATARAQATGEGPVKGVSWPSRVACRVWAGVVDGSCVSRKNYPCFLCFREAFHFVHCFPDYTLSGSGRLNLFN